MPHNRHIADALQRLLTVLIDTEQDFEVAAENTRAFSYYAECEQDAARRKKLKRHLHQLIKRLGRQPEMTGSLWGFFRRSLGGLRGGDSRSGRSIRFLKREEARLAEAIRAALSELALPTAIRSEALELMESLNGEEVRLDSLSVDHNFTLRHGQ